MSKLYYIKQKIFRLCKYFFVILNNSFEQYMEGEMTFPFTNYNENMIYVGIMKIYCDMLQTKYIYKCVLLIPTSPNMLINVI